MSAVVAINPATSTCAPGPKNTPAGLTIQTCPFASRLPMMLVTLLLVTRLSATELEPGCTNCTVEPTGMLKALQVMIALLVLWVMIEVVAEGVLSAAPPDTTLNPESPLLEDGRAAAAPRQRRNQRRRRQQNVAKPT